ncbi:hypothetical protein CC78DRAFT_585088 [Lojkania enalia]|uniref:Uncharacterized protein n=1 Tax=Lojkania enalia TaxID=147567 RepID=A0A9P4JZP3_9PLEO|nr:hypothetical protein CC78DRAFT_585088 [Didymosphaeria enalia]
MSKFCNWLLGTLLVWKYAKSLHSDGRYKEAEKPFQELLEARSQMLDGVNPDQETLTCMVWLASTYRELGQ